MTQAAVARTSADFTLSFVLNALVQAKILTPSQAQDVRTKEHAARARVLKQVGADKDEARYTVSPIEVVAAFQVPLAGGRTLDQDKVSEVVAAAAGVGYKKIDPLKLDMALATRTVSKPYAQKHVLLPLERTEAGTLVVAVANPFDRELLENLHRLAGMPIEPVLSAKADILKAISDIYGFKRTLAQAATDFAQPTGTQIQNFEQLVSLSSNKELDASDKPIVNAVDYLLRYAYDNRASDIHIEPKRDSTVIRLRIDGVLHPVYTLPTAFGEKVVIRIFDPETLVTDIAQLGFDESEKGLFESWIDEPHGLILVTGPTGSGKTTTLYSALKAVAGPDVNVTTIEDPIEMVWDGFNQVQVQPKIDLDFANALRHILRQDPDVIMVGEIRDGETAENAIQAALTGHLVLSTLHTNDAVGAVSRMKDLGVPPFLLSSCLLGVMAQRLLRRVCSRCAQEHSLTQDELLALGAPLPLLPGGVQIVQGAGCVHCRGTGFYGRTGVFEIMSVTAEIREAIARGANTPELVQLARKAGMRTLREAAVRKLASAKTAFDEVVRMTASAS